MIDKGYVSSIPFPDPRQALAEGVVAVGGRLDVGTLYHAYVKGIFPWPQDGYPMLWFSPEERGILIFDELRVPRSLQRTLKKNHDYRFTKDQAFRRVVEACRRQFRPGQFGTWIIPEMVEAYERFHDAGFAHSFEVWKGDELVGGLYGVFVEGVFSGESMFHAEPEASKRALIFAIESLRADGVQWIDTQMVTDVVERLGGRLIPRNEYLNMVRAAQETWNRRGRA